jgi:SAM-dependent methyltransferase
LSQRPLYVEYAWAYDLLIDRPVRKECDAIVRWFGERGIHPGATVLDAGCGTGRYAIEIGRRGFIVRGVDLSADLIAVAKQSAADLSATVSFEVGDLWNVAAAQFDAILCRGALDDALDDDRRRSICSVFARALSPGGVAVLDVRDWDATAERRTREPLFRKRVDTGRGRLTFTSVTRLDQDHRRLLMEEEYILDHDGDRRASQHEFVRQCWTRDELHTCLVRAGFGAVAYFGAYDPAVAVGATDRLVAVGQLQV